MYLPGLCAHQALFEPRSLFLPISVSLCSPSLSLPFYLALSRTCCTCKQPKGTRQSGLHSELTKISLLLPGQWDDTFKYKTHPYACDYQGKYILSANMKTWTGAKLACEKAGLMLAKVRSKQGFKVSVLLLSHAPCPFLRTLNYNSLKSTEFIQNMLYACEDIAIDTEISQESF